MICGILFSLLLFLFYELNRIIIHILILCIYVFTFNILYAQRPEATAVASMEIWNQKMYRWIKKGSKGIALIDNTSGPKTKLRYVFDVGDTYKVSRCLFYFVSAKY